MLKGLLIVLLCAVGLTACGSDSKGTAGNINIVRSLPADVAKANYKYSDTRWADQCRLTWLEYIAKSPDGKTMYVVFKINDNDRPFVIAKATETTQEFWVDRDLSGDDFEYYADNKSYNAQYMSICALFESFKKK